MTTPEFREVVGPEPEDPTRQQRTTYFLGQECIGYSSRKIPLLSPPDPSDDDRYCFSVRQDR